jgi:hypothetical protein
MNCEEARQFMLLAGYGELSFEEEEALELHIASCPECQAARAENATLESLLAQAELEPPAGLLARCRRDLAVRIGEESSLRRRFSVRQLWDRWVVHPPMWLRPVGAMAMLAAGFFAARIVPESPMMARYSGGGIPGPLAAFPKMPGSTYPALAYQSEVGATPHCPVAPSSHSPIRAPC